MHLTTLLRPLACLAALTVATPTQTGQVPDPAPDQGRSLTVRVTDARGRPAARVPLVLGEVHALGDQQVFRALAGSDRLTDATGAATFALPESAQNLHVQAQVVAEPPLRKLVGDRDGAASMPLTMQLPPTGMVRVIVYGEDERPHTGVGDTRLRIAGDKRFFDRVTAVADREPEGAMFAWVTLDQELEVSTNVQGIRGPLTRTHPGPRRPGELIVIDLRMQAAPIMELRLFAADGTPLPQQRLTGVLLSGKHCEMLGLSTDDQSTLRYQPPAARLAEGAELILRRVGRDVPSEAVSIPLWPAWRGVRHDGDRRLVVEPVVAGGVVVDQDGKPVAGVELEAASSWMATSPFQSSWVAGGSHRLRTDDAGRFTLREVATRDAALPVTAKAPWCTDEGARIVIGQLDQRLTVTRLATATLRLPGAPDGADFGALRLVRRERRQPGMNTPALNDPLVIRDELLQFEDLRPGVYDLVLAHGAWDLSGPLIEAVPLGRTTTFADWRRHLRPVQVAVFDPQGTQLAAAVGSYHLTHGGYSASSVRTSATDDTLLMVPPGNRLVVSEPEYRVAVRTELPDRLVLHLRPRPRVTLTMPAGLRLPDGVRVQVQCLALEWLRQPGVEVAVHGDASLRIRPADSGAAKVIISTPGSDGDYREVWTGEIAVRDVDEPQEVQLPLDREVITTLVERMR